MRSDRVMLCGALATLLSFSMVSEASAGGGGTKLTGHKTASATITKITTYDWDLQKALLPGQMPYAILLGKTVQAEFTIAATRNAGTVTYENGQVTGNVCVTNKGHVDTVGLAIRDKLQKQTGTGYEDVASKNLFILGELRAGDTRCYPYTFNVELNPEASYRNVAFVSIENWAGYEGETHGIRLEAPVEITVTSREVDATATLTDTFVGPAGFTCAPASYTETLTVSKTLAYQVSMKNDSAACSQTFPATNQAALAESDTGQTRTASASISIYTGTCH